MAGWYLLARPMLVLHALHDLRCVQLTIGPQRLLNWWRMRHAVASASRAAVAAASDDENLK